MMKNTERLHCCAILGQKGRYRQKAVGRTRIQDKGVTQVRGKRSRANDRRLEEETQYTE